MSSFVKKIFISDFALNRTINAPDKLEFKTIQYQQQHQISKEKNEMLVSLSVDMKSENGSCTIQATVIGIFSFDSEESKGLKLEDFIRLNAPSTLMPYLRLYISDMTQRAGFDTFFLPLVNFKAWFERDKLQESEKQKEILE
jgi:preprotein translocase subunit SecB